MDLLNCKDISELENFLNAFNQKIGIFGSLVISDDGLIILSSRDLSNNIDLESVAADAANIFNSDNNFYKEALLSLNEMKVYVTRMDDEKIKNSKSMIFISILPPNIRYYKRKINKIKNKIKLFFI
ncbi:MAG: hypothetical protein EAX96_09715 [Candidatus Lokiarchaeota archaeon]|nr:hypothetical protein [Candidatus Lokiarchaeota archaeon]